MRRAWERQGASRQDRVHVVAGDCAAVECVDVYLESAGPLSPRVARYRIHSSTELDIFCPSRTCRCAWPAPRMWKSRCRPIAGAGGCTSGGRSACNTRNSRWRGAMKLRRWSLLLLGLLTACACPWNDELREFLNAHFWLPFAKQSASFERPNVRRMDAPFAGMTAAQGDSPLARLRTAYQEISQPEIFSAHCQITTRNSPLQQAVAAARADRSLTGREKRKWIWWKQKSKCARANPTSPNCWRARRRNFRRSCAGHGLRSSAAKRAAGWPTCTTCWESRRRRGRSTWTN